MISHQAVQPASLITNALYSFGDAVDGATRVITDPIYGAVSLPFNAVLTLVSSLRNPALTASVLSYITQVYLNPTFYNGGYAEDITYGLAEIGGALPNPLGAWSSGLVNGIAGGIGSVFNFLPDPVAGGDVFEANFSEVLGRAVWAGREVLTIPLDLIWDAVSYLAYLPADVEGSLESALRNPREIPGLISNLVQGAIGPNGLLGWVVYDLIAPLQFLPAPIGDRWDGTPGLVSNVVNAVLNVYQHLLDAILPNPVSPTPFALAKAAADTSLSATALVSAAPLAAAGAVTLDLPTTADEVSPKVDPEPKPLVAEERALPSAELIAAEPVTVPVATPEVPTEPATPAVDAPESAPVAPAPVADAKDADAKDVDAKDGDIAKDGDTVKDGDDGATGRHHKRDAKKSQSADEDKPAVRGSHRGEAPEAGGGRHRADAKKDRAGESTASAGTGEKADAAAA